MTLALGSPVVDTELTFIPKVGRIVTIMGDPSRGRRYQLVAQAKPTGWFAQPLDGLPVHKLLAHPTQPFAAHAADASLREVEPSQSQAQLDFPAES